MPPTDKFDACHAVTAAWEGGWSDNKKDRGGKTMYGVTQATLSAWLGRPASAVEIRSLSKATALQIYRKNYWNPVGGDELPPGVDLCVYDFGVNSGPGRSAKSLQTVIGVKADGWVGEETLKAVGRRHAPALIDELCDRRLAFLKGLGAEQWAEFGKGWTNRVQDVRRQAKRMVNHVQALPPANVPEEGTAKAVPAPTVEKTVSTEQKAAGAATAATAVTIALGPVAGFWRDNKDILTDPTFLGLAAILAAVVLFMIFRKPKTVEATE